jgi:hypothetical protein
MSRAQVPEVNDSSTVANSPTVELMTLADGHIAFKIVYSGLLEDSVVPDGEITNVVVPVPTIAASISSTSPVP